MLIVMENIVHIQWDVIVLAFRLRQMAQNGKKQFVESAGMLNLIINKNLCV